MPWQKAMQEFARLGLDVHWATTTGKMVGVHVGAADSYNILEASFHDSMPI